MEVSVPVIIVLVVLFLVLGLLLTRFKRNKYVPFISIAGAVFFLVYAFVNREYMYPSLFFFLLAAYTGSTPLVSRNKYVPFIGIVIAIFFLVYAFVNREYMYLSLAFCLLLGYSGVRALVAQKKTGQ